MDDLIEGYRRFRAGTWQAERNRFEDLSRLGQRPRALVIACSDSRTDPQMVFNAAARRTLRRPQCRQSRAALWPRRQAARQSAPRSNSPCGCSRSARSSSWATPCAAASMRCWTARRPKCPISSDNGSASPSRRAQRACLAPPEQRQDFCEHESVRLSLANLMTFPWIKDAVDAGHITLHGCFFDIRSGVLERLGEDGIFRPIPD